METLEKMELERLLNIKKNVTYIYNMDDGLCDSVDLAVDDFKWIVEELEKRMSGS